MQRTHTSQRCDLCTLRRERGANLKSLRLNGRHTLSNVGGKCLAAVGLPCAFRNPSKCAQLLQRIPRIKTTDSINVGG